MLETARSWAEGWTVSRRTPKPEDVPWGLRIDVGQPTQKVRHLLLDADADAARELISKVSEPTTCIKALLLPDEMGPWFSAEWEPTDPGFLMAGDLHPTDSRPRSHAPDGYSVTVTIETAVKTAGGDGASDADVLTIVRILTADGELAASGQTGMAATATACVFDQIVTEPAHQRRGLGTAVMKTLTDAAVENGASTGILAATVQGRALYEALGWKVLSPLTGFVYKPAVVDH